MSTDSGAECRLIGRNWGKERNVGEKLIYCAGAAYEWAQWGGIKSL